MKSPGRPPRSIEERYLEAFRETLPPERLRRIIDAVAEKAEGGDTAACRLILDRVLPIPKDGMPELVEQAEAPRIEGYPGLAELPQGMLEELARCGSLGVVDVDRLPDELHRRFASHMWRTRYDPGGQPTAAVSGLAPPVPTVALDLEELEDPSEDIDERFRLDLEDE